jgi:hypothetical protein
MRVALSVAAALALVLASAAGAAWLATGDGSGSSRAESLPTGSVPTASALLQDVTLNWAASSFPGGAPVSGYRIRRYNALTSVEDMVLTGCAGTVLATSCVESNVPLGVWQYTVTPAQGLWGGGESARSANVIV